jgi:predicted DNA-binding helix-hairpin-helix protein
MIVGADTADDRSILNLSESLYSAYRLRRVYYSAFSPIPAPSAQLPLCAPPLVREHRLYQADWLLRHYGFSAAELFERNASGQLDLDVDPKVAWALAHREHFPVDVNHASKEMLLRVPGLGVRNVRRVLDIRRRHELRFADLVLLRCEIDKAKPFVIAADYHPRSDLSSAVLYSRLRKAPAQLPLAFK